MRLLPVCRLLLCRLILTLKEPKGLQPRAVGTGVRSGLSLPSSPSRRAFALTDGRVKILCRVMGSHFNEELSHIHVGLCCCLCQGCSVTPLLGPGLCAVRADSSADRATDPQTDCKAKILQKGNQRAHS